MQKIIRYSLWLISLLGTFGTYAQSTSTLLDDLAYALEDTTNRREVFTAMQAFHTHTQVGLAVATVYENGTYAASSQGDITQWLGQQTHGITIFITVSERTKAFQACQMRVSEAVEILLPLEDREQIQKGLLEFYFRNSPIPSNAYTSGLLAGIAAMQKKILENKANVKEKLPDEVVRITHVDEEFSAGIDNDKLKIEYAIQKEYVGKLKAAKLEVYRYNGTLVYVKVIDIEESGEFEWDGKINHRVKDETFIRYDDSPFTVKITASSDEDFTDTFSAEKQSNVHPLVDEFLDNYDITKHIEGTSIKGKFEYYQELKDPLFDKISGQRTDEEILRNFSDGINYLGEKVKERTFLGRKVMIHENYWVYLQKIENNLNSKYNNKYVVHKDYTMAGFNIRFQRNSLTKVSNHAFGMALDVNAVHNPMLKKDMLYFLQLLSNYKQLNNPSTPEKLKSVHNTIIDQKYTGSSLDNIKQGFEHLDTCSLVDENTQDLIKNIIKDFTSYNKEFHILMNRSIHLRNEIHFFNTKTEKEKEAIKKELFTDIPKDTDKLLLSIKNIYSKERRGVLQNLFREGYTKAFLLREHATKENNELLQILEKLQNLYGFEAAIKSLKEACTPPINNDYTYWTTDISITTPKIISKYESVRMAIEMIEERKADYKEVFNESKFKKMLNLLNNRKDALLKLATDGFMNMDAEFAREFIDIRNIEGKTVIGWGGNWNSLKDYMHIEYIENGKFKLKN